MDDSINNLAHYACIRGLELIPPPILEFPNLKGYFGAFVSVKRAHELKEFPYDTHGCIGYWSPDFQEVSSDFLINKIGYVARQSTNDDERRTYFPTDVKEDSNTEYVVYLMKLPLIRIDSTSGMMSNDRQFNNRDYGLIVLGASGRRATYLPDVYPEKSWSSIKKLLEDKAANIGQEFYAYTCDIISSRIIDTIRKIVIPHIKQEITSWITGNYKGEIPYQAELYNGKMNISYDKRQYVRNIASIYDYLRRLKLGYKMKNLMREELINYKKIIEMDRSHLQELAFLLLGLQVSKKLDDGEYSRTVCKLMSGNISNFEPDFELCECGIAINEVCGNISSSRKILARVASLLEYDNAKPIADIENIFRYNWNCKFLLSLYRKHNELDGYATKMAAKLRNILLELYSRNKKSLNDLETNYLVVFMEAVSSLYKIYPSDVLLLDVWTYIFCLVVKRYTNGLLFFQDGKTARIDMVGHMLNAML